RWPMRRFGFVLGGLLLWQAAAVAQQGGPQNQPPGGQPPATRPATNPPAGAGPAAPAPLDPAKDRVDGLPLRWEQEMRKVQSLSAQLTRIEENKVFKQTDVFQGSARYLKASDAGKVTNLAMLEMRKKDKQDVWEKFVCTGALLYQWVPSQKEIRVHTLPPPKPGQVADDNFLSFLFGMKAEEAKKRYDLRFKGEDQYYFYVEIYPRFDQDRADFQKAR